MRNANEDVTAQGKVTSVTLLNSLNMWYSTFKYCKCHFGGSHAALHLFGFALSLLVLVLVPPRRWSLVASFTVLLSCRCPCAVFCFKTTHLLFSVCFLSEFLKTKVLPQCEQRCASLEEWQEATCRSIFSLVLERCGHSGHANGRLLWQAIRCCFSSVWLPKQAPHTPHFSLLPQLCTMRRWIISSYLERVSDSLSVVRDKFASFYILILHMYVKF